MPLKLRLFVLYPFIQQEKARLAANPSPKQHLEEKTMQAHKQIRDRLRSHKAFDIRENLCTPADTSVSYCARERAQVHNAALAASVQKPTGANDYTESHALCDASESSTHSKLFWGVFPSFLADHTMHDLMLGRGCVGQEHFGGITGGVTDLDIGGQTQKSLKVLATNGVSVLTLCAITVTILWGTDFDVSDDQIL
jgi:hypothetical protein